MLIMTENDVNPLINNDPMKKETTLSITPRNNVTEKQDLVGAKYGKYCQGIRLNS